MIFSPKNRIPIDSVIEGDERFREKFRKCTWEYGNWRLPNVQEYLDERDLILIPIASTEQHGPHLNLNTDTVTAVTIADMVSRAVGVPMTMPIWAGYSPQHMHEPGMARGTLTVTNGALLQYAYGICRSLIHHGFKKIIFITAAM